MKVLIMDKEQTWRLKLTELAAGWGYLPEAVSSEVEVWSTLEGCTEPVLLVLDQNALQDDQPGLVRKLRKIKEAQHLYVILISEPGTTEVIASGLGDGADDCVLKPVREEELRSRLAVGRRTLKYQYDLAKLSQELTARTRQISQLRTLDGLTGISNRQSFEERLTDEWRRALREGNHISLLMIDIDFFKEYNSTYGHLAGDECLRQVAAVLSASIGRGGDFVARYGGEEFAVLLPNTDKLGCLVVAEAIRVAIAKMQMEHASSGIQGYVTVSVGTATVIPGEDTGPEALLASADQALYQAKCSGRNSVRQAS
jgi:diguanylate cyclase (GGDEF)-like protein